jgi:cytochrome c oxidase subunit 3
VSIAVMFFAVLAGLGGWWLARQRLLSKPWLEHGVLSGVPDFEVSRDPAKRTALGFFLAVVGSMFALLIGAYFMRRDFGDWRALPMPNMLWINTGVLVLASLALEWTQMAARRAELGSVRAGVAAAGVCGLVFLGGQYIAWQELDAAGYYVTTNPANSFFYLITGLHGLHILGGLVALGVTATKVWSDAPMDRVRLSAELCATYWLFMLFVWVVLLSLLAGWAGEFLDFCAQLLS